MQHNGKRLFVIGERRWNTASRAQGAEDAGWEIEWSIPFWTTGLSLWRRYFQYRLRMGPDIAVYNRGLISHAVQANPTVVWVEEPYFLFPNTLHMIRKKTGALLVCAYSDDPRDPAKKSRHFDNSVKIYDFIFTTKDELQQKYLNEGCRYTGKFWKGYDPQRIFPMSLSRQEVEKYQTDVAFIGHADFVNGRSMRREPLLALANNGYNMKVWGKTWRRVKWPDHLRPIIKPHQLDGIEYTKAISGAKLAIQIPSRLARDTHSSRSVEIPACKTLMVAERTVDHQFLFEEDKEAIFFGSVTELVDKVDFYLRHEGIRQRIVEAGYDRCQRSGYSNSERMKQMLRVVEQTLDKNFG